MAQHQRKADCIIGKYDQGLIKHEPDQLLSMLAGWSLVSAAAHASQPHHMMYA